jgi:uncharacterized membrane protein YkvA (DUF1232 family)
MSASPPDPPQSPDSETGATRDAAASQSGESTHPSTAEREKLRNILLFLPRLAALLGRLIIDPEVSAMDKALFAAAVVYLASPFDIVPDFIPILGQVDDIYLVALCLLRLMNRSGPAKLRQHWDGPEDIVQVLNTVSDLSTRYLPEGVRNRLRSWMDTKVAEGPPPPSTPAG